MQLLALGCFPVKTCSGNGVLDYSISDEATGKPVISRIELWRPDKQGRGKPHAPHGPGARLRIDRTKQMPVRRTVPAGIGFVLDRKVSFELRDGPYHFRLIRGPEYRIISGDFTLERDSLDNHHVNLPRMVDMKAKGWLAGDCFIPPSKNSLPLRMAAEDLHIAATAGHMVAKPIPHRSDEDPIQHAPTWIREDVVFDRGLAYYGNTDALDSHAPTTSNLRTISEGDARIAIENPFAWQVPVWLATEEVDGLFLLGDWLRLDRGVTRVTDGPRVVSPMGDHALMLGRHAETVYRHCLECGIRIAPLSGSGSDAGKTPIGYNRIYATTPKRPRDDYSDGRKEATEEPSLPESPEQWWDAVLAR